MVYVKEQRSLTVIQDVPVHFVRRTEQEADCCKICAKVADWQPEATSAEVSMELKEQVRNDPDFVSKVITGDESWIYGYDPATK